MSLLSLSPLTVAPFMYHVRPMNISSMSSSLEHEVKKARMEMMVAVARSMWVICLMCGAVSVM